MSIAEKLSTIAENEQNVYNAGKNAMLDSFWDAIQNKGAKTNYAFAFSGDSWVDSIFYPKYNMAPTTAERMFYQFSKFKTPVLNLKERLNEQNVTIDFANCTNVDTMFYQAHISHLPELNFSKVTSLANVFRTSLLISIDKLILSSTVPQTFSLTFMSAKNLRNITIEGVIQRSISFSECPLTVDSMKSIILALNDYSGTSEENTYTVSFSESSKSLLDAEGETAEYNGETCTWAELIAYKKWVIA